MINIKKGCHKSRHLLYNYKLCNLFFSINILTLFCIIYKRTGIYIYDKYPFTLNNIAINKLDDNIDAITDSLSLLLNSFKPIPNIKPNNKIIIEKTINIPNDCICCGIDGMYPYPITNTNVVTPNSIYIFPISFFLNKSIIVNTRYKELKKLTKLIPFTYP